MELSEYQRNSITLARKELQDFLTSHPVEKRKFHNRGKGYFVLDADGKIIVAGGEALMNLQHGRETLRNRRFSELLCEEDAEIYREGVRNSLGKPRVKGFEFGAGVVKGDGSLLSHYSLRAVLYRAGEFDNVNSMLILLSKERYDVQVQPGAFEYYLGEIDSLRSAVARGDKVTLRFRRGEHRIGKLIGLVGKLLASSTTFSTIGVKDLSDETYTALRDPSLQASRGRLGIRPLSYNDLKE